MLSFSEDTKNKQQGDCATVVLYLRSCLFFTLGEKIKMRAWSLVKWRREQLQAGYASVRMKLQKNADTDKQQLFHMPTMVRYILLRSIYLRGTAVSVFPRPTLEKTRRCNGRCNGRGGGYLLYNQDKRGGDVERSWTTQRNSVFETA